MIKVGTKNWRQSQGLANKGRVWCWVMQATWWFTNIHIIRGTCYRQLIIHSTAQRMESIKPTVESCLSIFQPSQSTFTVTCRYFPPGGLHPLKSAPLRLSAPRVSQAANQTASKCQLKCKRISLKWKSICCRKIVFPNYYTFLGVWTQFWPGNQAEGNTKGHLVPLVSCPLPSGLSSLQGSENVKFTWLFLPTRTRRVILSRKGAEKESGWRWQCWHELSQNGFSTEQMSFLCGGHKFCT